MRALFDRSVLAFVLVCASADVVLADDDGDFQERVSAAVELALPLLETASAETAEHRTCFTCHGQAMPIVALAEAREQGFEIDEDNFKLQLDHTYAHLKRSKKKYAEGRGTGGQVDTAGWALWGLEAGQRDPDDVTDAVMTYLISKQSDDGVWECSSNRPPSEKSDFATTYVALRGFESFTQESNEQQVTEAREKAAEWFATAQPQDTEDRVFHLLTLPYVDHYDRTDELIDELKQQQRDDGGWSQLPELETDAYATATVLYALSEAGLAADDSAYRRGLEFLIESQKDDGSWHVKTRSKPFQKYFETGYPHGKDQFISTTAACWATIALLRALEESET